MWWGAESKTQARILRQLLKELTAKLKSATEMCVGNNANRHCSGPSRPRYRSRLAQLYACTGAGALEAP